MDDEVETLMVGVRADTRAFAADAAAMRTSLEQSLGLGAERAGGAIERGLARAVRTGKLGFDDLARTALNALSEIAAQSVTAGIGSLFGSGTGGGLAALGTKLATAALGLPGRATGGPVSPGRGFVVGERGPELFVPTSAGSVVPGATGGGERRVAVTINLNAAAPDQPRALARSGRQVARAVADALARAER